MEATAERREQDQASYAMEISGTTELTSSKSRLLYFTLKRIFDIVFAVIGIVLLVPVFLAIAISIKLEDGGSILYFRKMVGLRGRCFTILKFRTMIPDADTYLKQFPGLHLQFEKNMKLQNDPRVTRIGKILRKTYLDELPQLFNVLVGQMSFVGPRTIHQRELVLYGEYAQKRHTVKPGITGLWQVNPNRYRDYQDRIPLDMQYVDSCCFLLDLVILVKTLKIIFTSTGV
jgi:exopolysaccharide production protein ExoY